MTSIVQERENFLRLAILVIDHSKAALISLIELDILNKHLTFEQFLNQNQHEIYHLCYNNRRCCRCSPGSSLSRIHRIIFPSQMQVLFDTAANMHGHRRGPEYCCSFAKKGIGTDVLDLILARCLLVYCCTDVFWYSCLQFKGTSFEDFLNQNKHMIYHCRQYNQGCCHCQNHCKLQANRQIVNAHQWNAMFISSSGLQMCRKRSHSSATNCICFISAITGITEGNLDIVLQQTILEYCCSTRKSVETLVKIRNNVYGNTNSTRISDSDYTRIKNDIESAILDIAIVCGNEPMSKTALNDVYCRNFDHSQFVQYQNSLSETNRDTKSVRELLAYIQSSPMTLDQVMKTLQTIKEGQNADKPIDAKLQKLEDKTETISSIIESDSKIPDEINRLDKKSIERYCQLLKGKMDKRQHFRLVVVGPKGSGKTSLVRRILQQPLDKPSKVRSTNGIDIHILKSKIQTKSGKWIFMEGVTNRQVANMRLKRCLVEKNQNQETVEKNDVLSDKDEESKMSIAWSTTLESRNVSPISSSDKSDILNRKDFYPNSRLNNEEGKISDALPTILESEDESEDLFYSRVQQSISEIDLEDVLNVELDENEFATIDLWDFAGDRQFYNTHHTFLSKEALYIVTVDMTKDVESILGIDGEDPNFWFQTLHYYGNKVNTRTRMDPSVILVGTKIDLCRGNEQGSKKKLFDNCCRESSFKKHIRDFSLLSNTDENNEEVFEKLRLKIFDLAKKCPSWDQEIPVRWIHLEKTLLKLSNEKPIVTRADVIKLGLENLEPIETNEEVDLFLKYHHETGDFVFFEDIQEYVVLSPQWLSNAFKCIITSDELQKDCDISSYVKNDWDDIRKTGKLSNRFIDHILEQNKLSMYKNHILTIMEKYDIIVRSSSASGQESFYVPCMVETTAIDHIDLIFDNKSKTSCLCFVFDFLPMPIFNHVLAACTRRFKISKKEYEPVFFKGMCLFDLDDSGCEKLFLLMYQNVIQVQVWKWECSKNKIEKSYSGIRTLICSDIERAQVNRYKSNIPYKTQLKCNITLYSCFKGMKDHDQLRKMEEYYCEEHEQSHDAKQIWTDWYEEDPKESLIDLNHRHINFTKMGIITLDVLADALYDLILVADPNFTTPRSECDISKLYEIHRNKMNVFIPSRGRWGGQWVDLNTNATAPGDDIERIRLTRNELQHSSKFELQDARFFQLCNLHKKVLGRFETKNNVFDYVQRFEIILNKKIAFLDWKRCKENIIFVCAKLQLPSSITASKGCGCTINCEINSRLPSESRICWFKDHNGVDEPVIVDSIKYHGSTIEFPSLVISNADKCDEGFYACRIMYPTDYQYEEDTETVVWPKTYLHVNNQ
ncbi:uncharacterized protein LOC127699103 isoform X1 [Mytilus californianus]|uniref:uncharacterized protein LOC127699103 isoform X1 n=1 Tax=Mytilus californianus TaxID=6549 RepID=UPI002247E01B|nr:uncharacterized protein LOC127699103 isoform X1 [Mytilus californianus]